MLSSPKLIHFGSRKVTSLQFLFFFLSFFFFFKFEWVFCLHIPHACLVTVEVKKTVLDPLELELQMVINLHAGTRSQTESSRRESVISTAQSSLRTLTNPFQL